MKLKEINRTATFAWSPGQQPLIAAGTVAGALDASFSNESTLEIFEPNLLDKSSAQLESTAKVSSNARFNRLAWGNIAADTPKGIIAGGKENGELDLWNPALILEGADAEKSLVFRNDTHKGAVRGLDFNNHQANLLASGAENGEIFIWDLNNPSKPYSPGNRSQKLEEVTSVTWNNQVQHILATASSTGYSVVWDLRNKREVMQLYYPGAAPSAFGANGMSMGAGGRRGISSVVWNPDNATQLITSSEDDSSPVIMMWDLRNAHAPEKILNGHSKGVLSLSWCKRDADLLLSCGKDNRVLCWNPQTSEISGELPPTTNWAFDVQWCPRNPDLLAVASFDGKINIHSLQSTQEEEVATAQAQSTGADIFDVNYNSNKGAQSLSLKQPPKWLRRTVGAVFGFGGKLITFQSSPGKAGSVHVADVVTEPTVVSRSDSLETSLAEKSLDKFCEQRIHDDIPQQADNWKVMRTLFEERSRAKLVEHLGLSRDDVSEQITAAIKKLDLSSSPTTTTPLTSSIVPEVSTKEAETPSEPPMAVSEDGHSEVGGKSESVTSEPATEGKDEDASEGGLFDNAAPPSGADFFSQTHPQLADLRNADTSSVAATQGTNTSAPSSVVSFGHKSSAFRIYPAGESDSERLVTRAIVLGDFESAVNLTIASGKWADALLIAHGGSPELFLKTQKRYFEHRGDEVPFLRLLQGILSGDFHDIVQNADLQEWQEIIAILCAFARPEEFATLCDILGQRLEHAHAKHEGSGTDEAKSKSNSLRRNAVLCYLASGSLDKVIPIWSQELIEEEKTEEEEDAKKAKSDPSKNTQSYFTYHAKALQHFIEKVSVFRASISYEDADLNTNAEGEVGGHQYKLTPLYEKYLEYAGMMAAQGRLATAVKYLNLTPIQFRGAVAEDSGESGAVIRDRLYQALGEAGGAQAVPFPFEEVYVGADGESITASTQANGYDYSQPSTGYAAPAQPTYDSGYQQQSYGQSTYNQASYGQSAYGQPAPSTGYYNDASQTSNYAQPAYGATQSSYQSSYDSPYGNTAPASNYSQPPPPPSFAPSIPAPPQPLSGAPTTESTAPPVLPAAKRRDIAGWNDAPPSMSALAPSRKSATTPKPAPIASPFPNMPMPTQPLTPQPGQGPPGHPNAGIPPPPVRGSSAQAPPQASQYGRPPSRQASVPPPPPPGQGRPAPPPQPQAPAQPQYSQQQAAYNRPAPHAPAGPPAGPYQQQYGAPQQQGQYGAPGVQAGFGGPGGPRGGPPVPPKAATPQPKAPTPVKKHPAGDRSHIPAAQKPIVATFTNELNRAKANAAPHQKRQLGESEKKLNVLFDAMNNEDVSESIMPQLHALAKAMGGRDYNTAQRIQVELHTTKTELVGGWITGIKWLIDVLRQQG